MEMAATPIEGLSIVKTRIFRDERGYFFESFKEEAFASAGLPSNFVQDNVSLSEKGVLRGLHFQKPNGQGKFVRCLKGSIYDVAVDLRPDSKTFGKYFGLELNDTESQALYIPPAFAHGFCVLSEEALVSYKCTTPYSPADEKGFLWNDADLNIRWPVNNPKVSPKDTKYPSFREFAQLLGK